MSTDKNTESNWLFYSKITGFALILGGLICSVIAALWFTGDFVATSVMSPNLSSDGHVSDFNDFNYIGESLSGKRFFLGSLLLVMSIATIIQGLLLLSREGKAISLFLSGGIALVAQVLFLMNAFYLPVFVVFILTTIGLYLATEWNRIQRNINLDADAALATDPGLDLIDDEINPEETRESFNFEALGPPPVQEVDTFPELDLDINTPEDGSDIIPTLTDEINTEGLVDDSKDQMFAKEAAFLSDPNQESQVELEPETLVPTEEMFPQKEKKLKVPLFENELRKNQKVDEPPAIKVLKDKDPEVAATRLKKKKSKKRVWNLVDWIISGLIVLVIIAILLIIIAR